MNPGGLEATYIRDSHSALIEYVEQRKYPFGIAVSAVAITVAGAGAVALIATAITYLPDWLHWVPASGDAPEPKKFAAARIVLAFATLVGGIPVLKYVARFWPALAEYLGQRALFVSFDEDDTVEKQVARVKYRIENAVRRQSIGPGRPFDPADFLCQESVRTRRAWLALTFALLLSGAGLIYRVAAS